MGSFKVAFGGDGAPFGKDDQALHFFSNFFRATALYLSCTPTSWAIGYVLPIHAKQLWDSVGMGLGINGMEGREAKHIALAKFTHNT